MKEHYNLTIKGNTRRFSFVNPEEKARSLAVCFNMVVNAHEDGVTEAHLVLVREETIPVPTPKEVREAGGLRAFTSSPLNLGGDSLHALKETLSVVSPFIKDLQVLPMAKAAVLSAEYDIEPDWSLMERLA